MLKNTGSQIVGAQMVTAADGSAFTGSVTCYYTLDGGSQTLGSVGSGVCTHEGNGFHTYTPTAGETNGDHVAYTFVGSGAVPVTVQGYTVLAKQTGDNFARLGAPSGASIAADLLSLLTRLTATRAGYLDQLEHIHDDTDGLKTLCQSIATDASNAANDVSTVYGWMQELYYIGTPGTRDRFLAFKGWSDVTLSYSGTLIGSQVITIRGYLSDGSTFDVATLDAAGVTTVHDPYTDPATLEALVTVIQIMADDGGEASIDGGVLTITPTTYDSMRNGIGIPITLPTMTKSFCLRVNSDLKLIACDGSAAWLQPTPFGVMSEGTLADQIDSVGGGGGGGGVTAGAGTGAFFTTED